MNNRQILCLQYLNGLMEARAKAIGRSISAYTITSRKYGAIGGGVCRSLMRKGLVAHVPELNCWRITARGREALFLYVQSQRPSPKSNK